MKKCGEYFDDFGKRVEFLWLIFWGEILCDGLIGECDFIDEIVDVDCDNYDYYGYDYWWFEVVGKGRVLMM